MSNDASAFDPRRPDAYTGVVLAMLAASALGTAVVTALGLALGNPVVVDAGGALALATAILVAVAAARRRRRRGGDAGEAEAPGPAATAEDARSFNVWLDGPSWVARHLATPQGTIAAIGAVALLVASGGEWARTSPSLSRRGRRSGLRGGGRGPRADRGELSGRGRRRAVPGSARSRARRQAARLGVAPRRVGRGAGMGRRRRGRPFAACSAARARWPRLRGALRRRE